MSIETGYTNGPGAGDSSPAALVDLAQRIALEAGEIAAAGQSRVRVLDTKSSPTDVVTEMDQASERHIRDRIVGLRPTDAVLGEEDGDSRGSSGVRWIVDPIDGTVNYLYGRPDWAVSIAVEDRGTVVAGVVAAPALGRTYTAIRGGGAWDGQRRLRRDAPPELDTALVATGFGYAAQRRQRQAEILRGLLPRVRDIRRAGSSALDICAVAAGEADAYYEHGLSPWDWSAAALVATEAKVHVREPTEREPTGVQPDGRATDLLVAAPEPLCSSLDILVGQCDPGMGTVGRITAPS
ncbi:inositol monophosphatase family protein [Lipingzhangella sp. LS1_29]|uniref:Inositol-1-monophosphatase n=1 Tax=Lipingzhangella rawalii TaxID=2055835 RepID=A0ABU2H0J0_9ACTN|nr:inositol monophosphatase family protein [Lipingzhangella rawalii]MDS1268822.1 inositol monophosphatase family protein [Lipingzhangella rawalii]